MGKYDFGSLSCDGTNSLASWEGTAGQAPIPGLPFSMAVWHYSTDLTVNAESILSVDDRSNPTNYAHRLVVRGATTDDPLRLVAIAAATSGNAEGGVHGLRKWHHAAGVWSSLTNREAFIDGRSVATDTTSIDYDTNQLDSITLGAIQGSPDNSWYQGNISVPCIWAAALTPNEVRLLANGSHPLTIRPDAIVWFAPLAGHARDVIGGLDLTLAGNAAVVQWGPPLIAPRSRRSVAVSVSAGTPSLIQPPASEAGLLPDEPVRFVWTPYSGAGAFAEARIQIATDAGFGAADIVLDTQLRAVDGQWLTSAESFEWLDPKTPGETYHWRVQVRSDVPKTSSWATSQSFSTSTPGLTAAKWRQGQP